MDERRASNYLIYVIDVMFCLLKNGFYISPLIGMLLVNFIGMKNIFSNKFISPL